MTLRSAPGAFFSPFSAKIPETPSTFRVAAPLPNRENVYNEGKFFVFSRSRSFVSSDGDAQVEKRSNRRATRRARRERAPESALTLRGGATCVVEIAK